MISDEMEYKHNFTLDLLRTISLFMLIAIPYLINTFTEEGLACAHVFQGYFNIINISAPAVFLFAFGIAALRFASESNKWIKLREIGFIGILYQGLKLNFHRPMLDFILFLFVALLMTIVFKKLLVFIHSRLIILIGVLCINLIICTKENRNLHEYPAQLLPWAVFFILGMAVGNCPFNTKNRIMLFIYSILLFSIGLITQFSYAANELRRAPVFPYYTHPASVIPYLGAILLCLYAVLGFIIIKHNSALQKIIKVFSDNIFQGIVIASYIQGFIAHMVYNFIVYNEILNEQFASLIAILIIITVIYYLILLMAKLRKYLITKIGEQRLYRSGLILGIVTSMIAILLFFYPNPYDRRMVFLIISFFSLPYISLTFMRSQVPAVKRA